MVLARAISAGFFLDRYLNTNHAIKVTNGNISLR